MRMTAARSVGALVCACLAAGGGFSAAQGTGATGLSMFRYDAARTGVAPDPLTVPLSLSWKFTPDFTGSQRPSRFVACPAASGEAVYYFVGRQLYALDRATGSLRWDKPLDLPDVVDSTPLVLDRTAVFGCGDGKVYFVELGSKSGRVIGSFDLRRQHTGVRGNPLSGPPRVQSSPVFNDGRVFFGGDDGWVYALDLKSQQKVWEFRTNGPIKASPTCWNHGVYVASMDGNVYGLSERSGRLIWRSKLATKDVLVSPVVANYRVIVAAGKYLYACDAGANGYVRWRFEAKGNVVGTPAAGEGKVFFGDTAGLFYAVDIGAEGDIAYWDTENPYLKWQMPPIPDPTAPKPAVVTDGLDQPVRSSPTLSQGMVIYRSGPYQVNALRASDGTLVWHYALTEDAAAVPREVAVTPVVAAPATGSSPSQRGLGGPGGAGGRRGAPGAAPAGLPGASPVTTTAQTGPTLVFEQSVVASPVAAGGDLFVLANDGALFGFSANAADAVPPRLEQAGMEVPAQGDGRFVQSLKLYDSRATALAEKEKKVKVRGAGPIYLRVKVFDAGSGVDPQSLRIRQESGGPVGWEAAYDAAGGFAWAIYEPKGDIAPDLADGEYVVSISIKDWAGNEARKVLAFVVQGDLPVPAPNVGRTPAAAGGGPTLGLPAGPGTGIPIGPGMGPPMGIPGGPPGGPPGMPMGPGGMGPEMPMGPAGGGVGGGGRGMNMVIPE